MQQRKFMVRSKGADGMQEWIVTMDEREGAERIAQAWKDQGRVGILITEEAISDPGRQS
jgi:hypothetical protein